MRTENQPEFTPWAVVDARTRKPLVMLVPAEFALVAQADAQRKGIKVTFCVMAPRPGHA